jgi:hypothetical protein
MAAAGGTWRRGRFTPANGTITRDQITAEKSVYSALDKRTPQELTDLRRDLDNRLPADSSINTRLVELPTPDNLADGKYSNLSKSELVNRFNEISKTMREAREAGWPKGENNWTPQQRQTANDNFVKFMADNERDLVKVMEAMGMPRSPNSGFWSK